MSSNYPDSMSDYDYDRMFGEYEDDERERRREESRQEAEEEALDYMLGK